MPAINQRDWEMMLTCVARLFECEQVEQFGRLALQEIPKLVGSDHSTFSYVAPSVPKVQVLASSETPNHAECQRIFERHVSEHPVLNHYLATGDGNAFKISDFHTVREYHALPLYQQCYRELGYEDQMAIELFPPASELISIAFARDRRTFTERDRRILNVLRPCLAQAYRHVEKVALLKRGLDSRRQGQTAVLVTAVLLDAEDRPLRFGPGSREWLNRFFPDNPESTSRLPARITDWLRCARREQPVSGRRARRVEALEMKHEGQRLRLRVISDPATAKRILVLGLETMPDAARAPLGGRLTRREIEVLLEVEQGKTNAEAAAALGMSPLTARFHLERIFEKLRVPSRTAAVTQFRRLCQPLLLAICAVINQASEICLQFSGMSCLSDGLEFMT